MKSAAIDFLADPDNDARALRAIKVTLGAGVALLLVGLHLTMKGA